MSTPAEDAEAFRRVLAEQFDRMSTEVAPLHPDRDPNNYAWFDCGDGTLAFRHIGGRELWRGPEKQVLAMFNVVKL
jgi:hypothetical protein